MKTIHEIREAQREAEKQMGAKRTKMTMAEGLVDQIAKELDRRGKFEFHLISEGFDIRQWGVRVDFGNGMAHSENFFDFPTDELRTKIMLFS